MEKESQQINIPKVKLGSQGLEVITLTLMELGIGIVSYSPLGHGFFGGKAVVESLPTESYLTKSPRFTLENLEKNKVLYARLDDEAKKHRCTPSQLALAWLYHQGDDIIPIPGTTKVKNLHNNIGSFGVKLTKEDLIVICNAVPANEVIGARNPEYMTKHNWDFADTPLQ
ncbi:hypothetical protein ACFE04_004786 [Oxalis oulophora]